MIYLVEMPVIPAECFGTFEHSEARLEDLQAVLAGKVGKFEARLSGTYLEGVEELTGVNLEDCFFDLQIKPGDLQLCLEFEFNVLKPRVWKVASWKFSWLRYVSTETGESP